MEEIRIKYELDDELESKILQIHSMLQKLIDSKQSPFAEKYIPAAKLRQEANISARTELNWRAKGILKGKKIEGKIFYQISDLKDLFSGGNEDRD